jgi:PAS domain S-box-containing protein
LIAHGSPAAYLLALAATAVALGIRVAAEPWLGERFPFVTLFAAIVFAAWRGGYGPAVLALVAGAVAASLMPSDGGRAIDDGEFRIGLVLYALVGAACIAMFASIGSRQRRLEREIDARRAAEQVLAEREAFLRVTFASIGDGVIATDARGDVAYLNPIAQQMTGWTQTEAAGKPLASVFAIVNEHTRAPVENPVEKVLREGRIVGLANHTVLIAKDGTERQIDDSAAPIRDDAGRLLGAVLVFRDVTEQRRADAELRRSDARTRAVLESALDCIITMDHEGRVVDFNPAAERTFGHRRADVVGRELADVVIPPAQRAQHRKGLAHYLATGEGPVLGRRLEVSALHSDGSEFPVELAITRISEDGPPMFTAYLRDIGPAHRLERYRTARLAVTQALSVATLPEEGVVDVLRAVCESLDWDAGFFWAVAEDTGTLHCRHGWHRPEAAVAGFASASRARTLVLGEGLPGRVWAGRAPVWIRDVLQDDNFPRLPDAMRHDLHGAFGCPVVVGDRARGVIEFFSRRIREADADLLEMMATVAATLGQFLDRTSAEQRVRESERELSDFFENASIGLHWVGPDGIILRANQAELDMLGYTREEYVGRSIAEFHVDAATIDDILARLAAGERLTEHPARLRCRDGSIKDVLIDSSVLFRDGRFVHTRCFTRDVTRRRQAEGMLQAQERRTRAILESITDAFCMFDREWRFTYVNRQAEELLGRCREELVGRSHWDVYPDTIGTEVERQYRRALEENVATAFEYFYPPHDRWYEGRVYPSHEGLSVFFRDVTSRRRSESALRESEEKFRLLADTIPQLAWVAKPDGHIFWYNRRWYEYTGTTPEQMEGWGWQSVHDPEVLPVVLERWRASIAHGEPFEMVFPLKGADGRFRHFLTRVNPLRDPEGNVLSWFGTNTDVSEQKRAADELHASEQRVRLATEATSVGIWEWHIATGRMHWDAQMFRIYGLAQTADGDVPYDTWRGAVMADERARQEELLAETVRRLGHGTREFRIQRGHDGEVRHIQSVETVRTDEHGRAEWVVGTNLDITDRIRHESVIAGQKQVLELLVQGAPLPDVLDALCDVVEGQNQQHVVASVLLVDEDGQRLRSVGGRHVPRDYALAIDGVPIGPGVGSCGTAAFRGEQVVVSDIAADPLWVDFRDLALGHGLRACWSTPIFSSQRKVLGTFAVYYPHPRAPTRDELRLVEILTRTAGVAIERRRDEQALRDADRRKDEFLATLAHELRNPLAPMRNSLELIKRGNGDLALIEQARSTMERQLRQMVRLIDDLLDVSRITRDRLELKT